MSQFPSDLPPASPPPVVAYGPPQPRPTNGWAIVSLICGIIGCLVITPIAGIITGLIGLTQAKRLRSGRGMAIAGIILSVLWIVGGLAVGGATYYGVKAITAAARQQAIDTINAAVAGDVVKIKALSTLTDDEIKDLSARLSTYGKCTDVSFTGFNSSNNNGVKTLDVSGTATFDQVGAKGFRASGGDQGNNKFLITDLQVD